MHRSKAKRGIGKSSEYGAPRSQPARHPASEFKVRFRDLLEGNTGLRCGRIAVSLADIPCLAESPLPSLTAGKDERKPLLFTVSKFNQL